MEATFQKSAASLNSALIDNDKSALGFGLSVNKIVDRYPIKQPNVLFFFEYCKGGTNMHVPDLY